MFDFVVSSWSRREARKSFASVSLSPIEMACWTAHVLPWISTRGRDMIERPNEIWGQDGEVRTVVGDDGVGGFHFLCLVQEGLYGLQRSRYRSHFSTTSIITITRIITNQSLEHVVEQEHGRLATSR